jgi:hypothetical protein
LACEATEFAADACAQTPCEVFEPWHVDRQGKLPLREFHALVKVLDGFGGTTETLLELRGVRNQVGDDRTDGSDG